MFSLRGYMTQLLICVIFKEKEYTLCAYSIKGGNLVRSFEKTFEVRKKLLTYIRDLSINYQLYYISVFLDSPNQGLAPVDDKGKLSRFGVDTKSVQCVALSNAQAYATKSTIKEYQKLFENYGEVDFIFSPFALLYHCINEKIKIKPKDKKLTLYILRHYSYTVLMICEARKILFGTFSDIKTEEEEAAEAATEPAQTPAPPTPTEEQTPPAAEQAKEEVATEEGLQELGGLIDEKPDDTNLSLNSALDLSNFGTDMDMCTHIFSNMQEFYNNPLYEGAFINELVIFDNSEVNQAVLDYIESEIFLQAKVIQVDTFHLMNELMRKELEI